MHPRPLVRFSQTITVFYLVAGSESTFSQARFNPRDGLPDLSETFLRRSKFAHGTLRRVR